MFRSESRTYTPLKTRITSPSCNSTLESVRFFGHLGVVACFRIPSLLRDRVRDKTLCYRKCIHRFAVGQDRCKRVLPGPGNGSQSDSLPRFLFRRTGTKLLAVVPRCDAEQFADSHGAGPSVDPDLYIHCLLLGSSSKLTLMPRCVDYMVQYLVLPHVRMSREVSWFLMASGVVKGALRTSSAMLDPPDSADS